MTIHFYYPSQCFHNKIGQEQIYCENDVNKITENIWVNKIFFQRRIFLLRCSFSKNVKLGQPIFGSLRTETWSNSQRTEHVLGTNPLTLIKS